MGTFAVGERNKMLDAVVGRGTYTAPAGFFAKLHLGDPGAAGTSNPAAHTTRVAVTFGVDASGAALSNTADVEFPSLTAEETITHVSFWSASSGGTFLGSDDLSASAAMQIGETFRIPTGDLDLSMTGVFSAAVFNGLLNAIAARASYTASAAFYCKLHTGAPGSAGTSNAATNTTRVAGTFGAAASAGAISNTAALEWLAVSTDETYSHVSWWDASSAGNFLGSAALQTPADMTPGENFRILTGNLDLALT